jgi:F-type H+-transporting ATPase subunit delta
MSELATLARPYAAAVFKRAKETDSTAQWSQELAFMSAVISNEAFAGIQDNPKLGKNNTLAIVLEVCQGVSAESENLLKLLVHNGKLSLLPIIATLFEAYKSGAEGSVDVEVSTAYPFSKKAEREFAVTLEKALHRKVHLSVTVDKSLIGGVLIRAGDRVIDGSVRGQLQQMRKALQ